MIMRLQVVTAAAAAAAALALASPAANAADNEAGVPLQPQEAAGTWTLETQGRDVCTLTLGARRQVQFGYQVTGAAACNAVLPEPVWGWMPTGDGMTFVGPKGVPQIAFNRWSNSLFVSHGSSGVDLQLRRGGSKSLAQNQ